MLRTIKVVLVGTLGALIVLPTLFALAVVAGAYAGNNSAQYLVGSFYLFALRDHKDAAKWYRDAASQGNVSAELHLGVFYDLNKIGTDTNVNAGKAQYWYTQAAEQGDSDAAFFLSQLYLHGRGIPSDGLQATKWFYICQKHPTQLINERAVPVGLLILGTVPKDIREQARELAKEWQAKPHAILTNPPEL